MGMAGFEPAPCGMVTGFPPTACRPVGRAATFFTTALPSELHSHSCPSFRAATGFCILPPFLKSRKSHPGAIPGKHPHLALCLPREAPLTPLDFRASIGGRSFPAATRFCYGLLEYHSVKTSTKARGLWARRYPGFPSKHRRPLSYLRPGVSLVGMKGFEPNMRLQTRHSFKAGSMTPASARIPFPRHIPMCARLSGPPAVFPCCQQIVSRRPLG